MRPHIAYLLAPFPLSLVEANSRFKTRIITGRRRVEDEDDELQLQRFSKILLNVDKAATFDTLHADLPFRWREAEPYDIVNPFGDFREIDFKALWTFDFQNDVLIYINRHHRARIPLGVLRSSPVTLGDMESLGPPVPSLLHPTLEPSVVPCWKPQVQVDKRNRAFIHRILRDFDVQWRHILRNDYNSITLRVLARGIIRLSTLDFEIREETGLRHGVGGEWVYITELPAWTPFETDIVPIGDVHLIVCHSIQNGLSKAKEHIASQQSVAVIGTDYTHKRPEYIILSVKHIVLCRAIGPYELEHTAPQSLFNGNPDVAPPSELALDYLLWALTPAISFINTPLLALPVEIQDIILGYAAVGPVAAARVGCILSLGTPYLWKHGPLDIKLEDIRMNRNPWSPVESQVWFSESEVGIVYRGRA
ncbi:hypothetical protein EJ05DRAFT_506330 [Pseudovirgaria hyperparasitica]|uniref:Uncharacterized protein n=1 Tax=Pseudovirgaria hyperparasitica TaxID=470096 RepID=A0A6A6WKE6_9PEZI|nr:uncharacterized protein EJ05DRAFT_506330 [Pseudovirgaria hyperparasitica]KAF2762626.1 hypothetical protein EJ05DRAFT_506330 [Pseudovirgaria hyperparasitica]